MQVDQGMQKIPSSFTKREWKYLQMVWAAALEGKRQDSSTGFCSHMWTGFVKWHQAKFSLWKPQLLGADLFRRVGISNAEQPHKPL